MSTTTGWPASAPFNFKISSAQYQLNTLPFCLIALSRFVTGAIIGGCISRSAVESAGIDGDQGFRCANPTSRDFFGSPPKKTKTL